MNIVRLFVAAVILLGTVVKVASAALFLGAIPVQYVAPNEELVLDMHRFYQPDTGSKLEIQGTNDVDIRWDEAAFQLHATAKRKGLFDLSIRANSKDSNFSTVLTLASGAGTGGHTFKFKPSEKPAKVAVAGAFNGWSMDKDQLAVGPDGVWTVTLPLKPGRYGYKFVVDGKWTLDPENPQTEDNGLGDKNSVLIIPGDPAGVASGHLLRSSRRKRARAARDYGRQKCRTRFGCP